ncbi:MAG: cysteine desulfurase family protein, partial [Fibrobacterota bacterium]
MKNVYMDNNATTPLHPAVKKAMQEGMEYFGNPSSMHSFGRETRDIIEEARGDIASFIGAKSDEIVFMGSGSEANNTVLNLFPCRHETCSRQMCGKNEIITTSIEHPCILESSKVARQRGVTVHYLEVDRSGRISLDELKSLISEKTALVSVMMANNEIGTVQ